MWDGRGVKGLWWGREGGAKGEGGQVEVRAESDSEERLLLIKGEDG